MPNERDEHFMDAVHWNDPMLLRAAGAMTGPDAIRTLLDTYKQGAPSRNAIQQWISRHRIPDRWRARLVYCLLREGLARTDTLFRRGPAIRQTAAQP